MLSVQYVTAQKPGAAHNEDLFGFKGDTFWLLDGATSSDGPPLARDAHWLVHELDTALNGLATLDRDVAVMAAAACTLVANRWPSREPCRPVAAMAVWRVKDGILTAAITGNVSLLVPHGDVVAELTDTRVVPAHVDTTFPLFEALAKGISFESAEFRALRRDMKTREAAALDVSANTWLASAAERLPDDFRQYQVEVPGKLTMLAATDGFMELRRFWHHPSNAEFLRMTRDMDGGLPGAVELLRSWERHPDSGRQFPRTKRHDDATAILLQIS